MAKNRIIIEYDSKLKCVIANVASSTLETKSKASILMKKNKIYLKSNSFTELIPIFVIFKSFDMQSDLDVFQLVGNEPFMLEALSMSLQDCVQHNVHSQK